MDFSSNDLKQLQEQHIEPAKAARQLNLLRTGQVDTKLERPCTVGDGIVQTPVRHPGFPEQGFRHRRSQRPAAAFRACIGCGIADVQPAAS